MHTSKSSKADPFPASGAKKGGMDLSHLRGPVAGNKLPKY